MNPLIYLSVGCRTIVCLWMQPMATTGNSNSEYTILSVYERWGNASCSPLFLYGLKKTKRPLFFTHQLLIVVCIMSKNRKRRP
ncbi:protein of unknown function [Streptococcus thermophilus]|nr:protein of unknown function [Streptococcus thermophilus]